MNRTSSVFSVFVHSFWAIAWENIQTISVQTPIPMYIIIFSYYIWLGMIRLKYNSFDTDIGIQMMQNKERAKRKAEILFLLFTLLSLYPYMPSERFR